MPADPFTERLARVRQRFVSTLESKIEDTYADLPKLVGDGPGVADDARRNLSPHPRHRRHRPDGRLCRDRQGGEDRRERAARAASRRPRARPQRDRRAAQGARTCCARPRSANCRQSFTGWR